MKFKTIEAEKTVAIQQVNGLLHQFPISNQFSISLAVEPVGEVAPNIGFDLVLMKRANASLLELFYAF